MESDFSSKPANKQTKQQQKKNKRRGDVTNKQTNKQPCNPLTRQQEEPQEQPQGQIKADQKHHREQQQQKYLKPLLRTSHPPMAPRKTSKDKTMTMITAAFFNCNCCCWSVIDCCCLLVGCLLVCLLWILGLMHEGDQISLTHMPLPLHEVEVDVSPLRFQIASPKKSNVQTKVQKQGVKTVCQQSCRCRLQLHHL